MSQRPGTNSLKGPCVHVGPCPSYLSFGFQTAYLMMSWSFLSCLFLVVRNSNFELFRSLRTRSDTWPNIIIISIGGSGLFQMKSSIIGQTYHSITYGILTHPTVSIRSSILRRRDFVPHPQFQPSEPWSSSWVFTASKVMAFCPPI